MRWCVVWPAQEIENTGASLWSSPIAAFPPVCGDSPTACLRGLGIPASIVDPSTSSLINITVPGAHALDPGFVIRQVLPDGFGGLSVSTRGWGTGSRPMFNSNWWAKCGAPIRAILVAKLASCGGLGVLFPQGRN